MARETCCVTRRACAAADPQGVGLRLPRGCWRRRNLKKIGVKTFRGRLLGRRRHRNWQGPPTTTSPRPAATDRGRRRQGPLRLQRHQPRPSCSMRSRPRFTTRSRAATPTSPPSVSAGTQLVNSVTSGSYALDSRVDFPSWKGHLLAYDATASGTSLVWDAGRAAGQHGLEDPPGLYLGFIRHPGQGSSWIPATGAIGNKGDAAVPGSGARPRPRRSWSRAGCWAIRRRVTRRCWAPWSTPRRIDVGQPGRRPQPGWQKSFSDKYKDRPQITYVGSDDGMLHAFYTKDVTVSGVAHAGGSEAFAYLPPEMLPVITKLYGPGRTAARSTQAHLRAGELSQGEEHLHLQLHRQGPRRPGRPCWR